MNERGQLEQLAKIGYFIGVLVVGFVISRIYSMFGDPLNLSPLIGGAVILFLIYIGLKN